MTKTAFKIGDRVCWVGRDRDMRYLDLTAAPHGHNYHGTVEGQDTDGYVVRFDRYATISYDADCLAALPAPKAPETAQAPQRPAFTRDLSLTPGSKVILLHLNKRGSISPLEALTTYNTLRLAPRIHELRQAGYQINTEMREDERGHRYARYSLAA